MLKRLLTVSLCLISSAILVACSSGNDSKQSSSSSSTSVSVKKSSNHKKINESSTITKSNSSSASPDASSGIPVSEDQGMAVFYTMRVKYGDSDATLTSAFQNKEIADLSVQNISGQNVAYNYNKSITTVFPENTYLVAGTPTAAGDVTFQLTNDHTIRVYNVPSHFQDTRWLTDNSWAKSQVDGYMDNPETWELQTPNNDLLNLMKTTKTNF